MIIMLDNSFLLDMIQQYFIDFKEYLWRIILPALDKRNDIDAVKRKEIINLINNSMTPKSLLERFDKINRDNNLHFDITEIALKFKEDNKITEPKEEVKINKINFEYEFLYKYQHLPNFDILNKLIGIYGEEYIALIKLRYYQFLGRILLENPIKLGNIEIDTRTHCIFVIPSAKGKKNFFNNIKEIAKFLGFIYEAPTSFHSEQLVGKVIERDVERQIGETTRGTPRFRRIKEYIPNNGYLDSDFLQMDEASDLLADNKNPQIEESRKFICIATDPYPKNNLSKKLIDHLTQERINFPSKSVQSYYIQPVKFNSKVVIKGFYRRFEKCYPKIKTNFKEIYEARLEEPIEDQIKLQNAFILWLKEKQIEAVKINWDFGNETEREAVKKALFECTIHLVNFARHHSDKGYQYSTILEQTYIERILRYACIIAFVNGSKKITSNHIYLGFMDALEFLNMDLNLIKDYCLGEIVYGYKWEITDNKISKLLDFLHENNCTTEDNSTISIESWKGTISQFCNVGDDRAHQIHLNMVKEGLIYAKQRRDKTKVWLAKLPNEFMGDNESNESSILELYKNIANNISHLIKGITTITTITTQSHKTIEITDSQLNALPPLPPITIKKVVSFFKDNDHISDKEILKKNCSDNLQIPIFQIEQILKRFPV